MNGGATAPDEASHRIDKWLWCARRFKSRTLAARFVEEAHVRVTRDGVTRRIDRASFQLRIGDQVSFLLGEKPVLLTVAGFADRRGSPAAARALYQGVAASPACKQTG